MDTKRWSDKYKKSIDCSNPKGFSQRAHCKGRKKKINESFQKMLKNKNNTQENIIEDFSPLVNHISKCLLEKYTIEQLEKISDEHLINELYGGAGLLSKVAKDTNLQKQLGSLAAAQTMKSKGAQQSFISDVRASLRGESGIKGFLTRNIAGIENIRLKRREEALKALTASPESKIDQSRKVPGIGSIAAQNQRKAFGPMSVEKDLIRQAGAEAIKQKANQLLQSRKNFDVAMKILNTRGVPPTSFDSKNRLERIKQTGLGPPELYSAKKPAAGLKELIAQFKSKQKQLSDRERESKQSDYENKLMARDAASDSSEPLLLKPVRSLRSLGRRPLSPTDVEIRRRNYIPDNSEIVEESVEKSTMKCNKPVRSTSAGKKMMVKACEGGKEKIVHFGAKGYGHNYSDAARKSFRARHKCGEKKSKLSAQYWACKKLWAGPKGSKASCPAGRKCKY